MARIKEAYRGVETLKDVDFVTIKFARILGTLEKGVEHPGGQRPLLLHEFQNALRTVDSFKKWHLNQYLHKSLFSKFICVIKGIFN